MVISQKQLRIKRSGIAKAGKGLFTTKAIKKGMRIAEYKGRITSWKEANHREGDNPYIFYVKRNHVIDALPYKKSKARYANDARGSKNNNGFSNNSKYVEEGPHVFIEATRDIPAGTEILVGYGKEYWDAIRYNKKLADSKIV